MTTAAAGGPLGVHHWRIARVSGSRSPAVRGRRDRTWPSSVGTRRRSRSRGRRIEASRASASQIVRGIRRATSSTRLAIATAISAFGSEAGAADGAREQRRPSRGRSASSIGSTGSSGRRRFATDLLAPINLCRLVLPASCALQASYGKIVNMSGGGATEPLPRFSAYAASKAASCGSPRRWRSEVSAARASTSTPSRPAR